VFAAVPYFRGAYDHYGYEDWERNLEAFFSYFNLTSNQKCLYTQRKLDEKTYWWWKDSHSSCRCWFVLQDLLRTRYAPHLLFTEFRETLEDIQKSIEEYIIVKVNTELELEPEVAAEPVTEPAVVDEPDQSQR